uniref:Beta-lactamase-related domain-containing protein n=2 Tax=Corethron hystrix TaxID=216773 RepID=A0A7S1FY57_9STRA|mmetsp:Transcript_3755/g.6981  ORF Transcript_3755/g.6981 Transcript_3755/m.6981 type:complete len:374 (+) Transcript_3755:592-1713(+)
MIASVSKTVVWTALSMVYDAGLFKIDDSIDKVMPFKVRNPGHKSVPLTYRMLYAHTNGIKDEYGGYLFDTKCPANKPYTKSLATVILRHTKKKSNWYKFKPGETHKYTNYGTALAALLVERHTGMEFTYFVQNYIFNPLAMKSSKFYRPRDGSASEQYSFNGGKNTYHTWSGGYCFPDYPSGQLWTTSADLAKFSRVMLNHGRLSSSPTRCLYSAKTGTQVFKKTAPGKGDGDSAMGWFVGKPYYPGGAGHDGSEGGVTTELFLHLDSPRIAIGWLANGELSYKEGKQMTQKMMAVAKSMGSGPAPPNDSCIKIWKGRNESCQDSEIFKFKKDKSCAWVASSLGRITKFCNKKVKDKLIKEWCPLACTNCLVE